MAIKVIISGYGKMGHAIEEVLKREGIECVECSEDIASVPQEVARECVCIDFTQPEAFRANYHCLADNFKAVVVGTTGWNDIEDEVKSYFEKVGTPMIYASNYSIGVNVLFAAADFISGLTSRFGGFSANIHEVHHVHKLDAPSGTAKSLAKVVDAHTSVPTAITYERIGEVFGVHTLTFESQCERLSLSHEAYSRQGLAEGAVMAARMTEGLSGVHEFKQLILK